ncbi:MAG: DUF1211 domain-containing protein, partial [Burkholderiales bacterium]|nr:DUF1211 domain-containing protein [Burkholderiales bacterium]
FTKSNRLTGEDNFRWRGQEISRLEGFSDAVFAFALTLLVVSLEVPKTFHELLEAMKGFVAFGACFAFLANIWFQHYRFFRRYGLQDTTSVLLNCVLLFCVLFYVYPLKFLFLSWFGGATSVEPKEATILFVVYGLGFAAVFLVFTLLHLHAWRLRVELQLDELEQLKTLHKIVDHTAMMIIGIMSCCLALVLPENLVGIAGYFYTSIGLYFWVSGVFLGKHQRQLAEKLRAV